MINLPHFNTSKSYVLILSIFALLSVAMLCSACQAISLEVTPTPTSPPPTPALIIAEQQPVIWNAWVSGPHGSEYNLGKGPNTYCARCHSPANWDPSATIDSPPNCVSCKFPHEDSPRFAEGNPLIPETEWIGTDCATCHLVENGVVAPGISWLNSVTGYNETVVSSTALCEKCHQDTIDLRHKVILDGTTHPGYTCTDCHNPHTTYASCGSSDCHSDISSIMTTYSPLHIGVSENQICLECHPKGMNLHDMQIAQESVDDCLGCHQALTLPPENPEIATDGHTIYHKEIHCVACHDAAGLAAKPIDDQDQWMAFRTTIIESLGRPNEAPYTSHDLQRQIDCKRCHFADNPWEISEIVTRTQP